LSTALIPIGIRSNRSGKQENDPSECRCWRARRGKVVNKVPGGAQVEWVVFPLQLSGELMRLVREEAEIEGQTVTEWLQTLIRNWFEDENLV
jgi:hypothetical protein